MTESGVPDYYDRLRDVTALDEQALYNEINETIDIDGAPQRVRGFAVTSSFFHLVRVSPVVGRAFDKSDEQVGNEAKVIPSYGFWKQLYAGDADAIGRTLRVSGHTLTIVGVMPSDFVFVDPTVRFWTPLAFSEQDKSDNMRLNIDWTNIGRLKPGATVKQVQDQVNALNTANLQRFPQHREILVNAGFYSKVERLQDALVRSIRSTLYLLWGAGAFVLLIGAVNLANLAVARSNFRANEIATRLALGAGHLQIARQSIIESLLLAVAGGFGGLALGWWMIGALTIIGLDRIPRASEIQIGFLTIGFVACLSVIAGVLIGIAPMRHLFNVNLSRVRNQESRTGTGGRMKRLTRRLLVAAQVACTLVLLIGTGLLLFTFHSLQISDSGFKPDGVAIGEVAFESAQYAGEKEIRLFMDRALHAIRAVPGVASAGATSSIPLGDHQSRGLIYAEGYVMKPDESVIAPTHSVITPGYFKTMGTRIVEGRDFADQDAEGTLGVMIVSQWLARKFWPGANPIGKRLYLPDDPHDFSRITEHTRFFTVVGVVQEVPHRDLAEIDPAGAYYTPVAQTPADARNYTFTIKTLTDPTLVMRTVPTELAKLDPQLPLSNVFTMKQLIDRSLMSRRAAMVLSMAFAWIALLLSATGIYGVLAYLVSQRMREIGIRIALGSTSGGIFKMVLREGVLLVSCGVFAGIVVALAIRRFLESQLSGISSTDPFVIAGAIALLAAIASAACVIPAQKATRVNPISVLNK